MNNNFSPAVKSSADFVTGFLNKNLPEWALYHSLDHTVDTVKGCIEIGAASGFGGLNLEMLVIAGWFHDTGYVLKTDDHEEISCEIAEDFLDKNRFPGCDVDIITKCIMATKTSNQLESLCEFVIRDADLISLGRDDYFYKNELLRREIELRDKVSIPEKNWLQRSIRFLEAHKYLTEYASRKYGAGAINNLRILKQQLST